MGVNIRRKIKVEKTTEFVERIKKVQEEAKMVLRRVQEEMKKQVDRRRREVEEWKKEGKVTSCSKDLVFKERLLKKLIKQYVRPYTIEEVVSRNAVKLKLLTSMRIHLVVNVSRIVKYRKPVKR